MRYEFEYNEYGEMSKVRYPTGGYERFEYGTVAPVGPQTQDKYSIWANRGVKKRWTVADPERPGEASLTLYEDVTDGMGGSGSYPEYYRIVRRVKFFNQASRWEANPSAVPDEMEEHFYYRDGFRPIGIYGARTPAYAYGLESHLNGKEYETRYYLRNESGLTPARRVLREYRAGFTEPGTRLHHPQVGALDLGWRNPRVVREITVLYTGEGQPAKMSLTRTQYDGITPGPAEQRYYRYGNPTQGEVFDYQPASGVPENYDPRDGLSGLDAAAFGSVNPLKKETTTWLHDEDTTYRSRQLVRLVKTLKVWDTTGTSVVRDLENFYDLDGEGPRGHLAGVGMDTRVVGTGWIYDRRYHDPYGNVTEYVSPAGRSTKWTFDTDHHAFVTEARTHPSPTVTLITLYDTDPDSGRLNWVEDPNGKRTTFTYEPDWPCRLLHAVAPEPNNRQTNLTWDDVNRTVLIAADHDGVGDGAQVTKRVFDGLDRLVHEGKTRGDGGWRWAGKRYDGRDRVTGASNPYGTTTDQAPAAYDYWTTTTYDALGRPVTVTNPDNTTREMTYSLNAETAADEAGHWKTLERDVLGRVVKVTEPNGTGKTNLDTTYAYLPSGELTDVFQGVQNRHFAYDGVGNLTSATLPELEFSKEWEYDPDGLVLMEYTRSGQAAGIGFTYDGIGRPLTKSLWNGAGETAYYEYLYDGDVSHGVGDLWVLPIVDFTGHLGRLTAKRGYPGMGIFWQECYAYDPPTGRVLDKYLRLNNPGSQVFTAYDTVTNYVYNLSGGLTDITCPSGKSVHVELDTENRPESAATESMAPLAGPILYAEHGALRSLTTPAIQIPPGSSSYPFQYAREYEAATLRLSNITLDRVSGRGRSPSDTRVMGFSYQYGPDGNVHQIDHPAFGGVDVETFAYDALDRLGSVSYGGLGTIGYGYDRYGNLLSRSVSEGLSGSTTDASFSFSASAMEQTNRLPAASGFQYDEAGNLTQMNRIEGTDEVKETLTYDVANRLVEYKRERKPQGQAWATEARGSYYYDDGFGRLYSVSDMPWVDETGCPLQDITETVYVREPAGETLTEVIHEFYSGECKTESGEYLFESVSANCNPPPSGDRFHYQFTDHLGSTRYTAGARWRFYHEPSQGQGSYCYQEELFEAAENLTPYGGFLTPNPPPSPLDFLAFDPLTFTGKPRDVESGLDYSKARYYSNNLGRWPSPDPLIESGRMEDPASWNRYAYVRCNPLNLIDDTGLDYEHLRGRQRELIDQWAAERNRQNNTNISAAEMYNGLAESQRTAYESVSHSYMNTVLHDNRGNRLGTLLDTAESINADLDTNQSVRSISGGEEDQGAPAGTPSDQQFRVYFRLTKYADLIFSSAVELYLGSNPFGMHPGYPISHRLRGGAPSSQASTNQTVTLGDYDVDYRRSGFWGLFNGHLTAANSDVRAGQNYEDHIRRFGPGLVAWWRRR